MYLEKMFGLNGKVAIVTGGGRGIGQVIAQGLAEAGAEVVILSRSGAEETVKLITEAKLTISKLMLQMKHRWTKLLQRFLSVQVLSISCSIMPVSACISPH